MARAGWKIGLRTFIAAAVLAAAASFPAFAEEANPDGAWAERIQILYNGQTRSVQRKAVRVWDFHPEKNLDFVWEPDPGQSPDRTLDADGRVTGKGKLVWRVRGSASYDPETVYSRYSGDLKAGRPHGLGRMEVRTGEIFDGQWKDGRLDGHGIYVDARGDRYEGMFVAGVPNGQGRFLSRTGEIFTGTFIDGKRNGEGTTRLAGGTVYKSEWIMGKEVGAHRPDVLADARISGLLKAQAGGGDAGKVDIGVSVDQRMNERSEAPYQHLVRDEDIAIYPSSDSYNGTWNGNGTVEAYSYFEDMDWENVATFAEVDLATKDKSKVKLDSMELKVASSEAYRKPMLWISEHTGCVGFRPDFSVMNEGWGGPKDMKMSVHFTRLNEEGEPEGEASRTFTRDIGSFDDGKDVSIRDVLDEAGVDTAMLETERFSCPSADSLNVCRSQVTNKVKFGELADYVGGQDQDLSFTAAGTLDYSWSDDYGNTYQQSEPFLTTISLAVIQTPQGMAECGGGFGGSPEALRYQEVIFPIDKHDYAIEMPLRGNRNVAAYTARLKLSSTMSSIHRFNVAAHFADGSTRESKPVTFYYFRPKQSKFETAMHPATCYLPEDSGGC